MSDDAPKAVVVGASRHQNHNADDEDKSLQQRSKSRGRKEQSEEAQGLEQQPEDTNVDVEHKQELLKGQAIELALESLAQKGQSDLGKMGSLFSNKPLLIQMIRSRSHATFVVQCDSMCV